MRILKLKKIQLLTCGLLLLGALWGVNGLLGFDVMARVFGSSKMPGVFMYALAGFAGIYGILISKTILRCRYADLHLPV